MIRVWEDSSTQDISQEEKQRLICFSEGKFSNPSKPIELTKDFFSDPKFDIMSWIARTEQRDTTELGSRLLDCSSVLAA